MLAILGILLFVGRLSVRNKADSDSQELTPRLDRGQFGILCFRFPQKTCEQAPVAATVRQIRGNGRLFPPTICASWLWDAELDP